MTKLLQITALLVTALAVVMFTGPLTFNNKQPEPKNVTPEPLPVSIVQMQAPNSTTEVASSNLKKFAPQPLNETKKTIRHLSLKASRTLFLSGEVGENALMMAEQIGFMNTTSSEPIYLILDSPGGSVLTGAILISAIQSSKAPVHTICYTLCASMAYMIHQYGSKRYAVDRAILMSHPASVGYKGDVDRIQSFITAIQRYTNKLEVYVAKRRGLTFEEYKNRIAVEYWVDAEDALKDNVVDELVSVTLQKNVLDMLMPGTENVQKKRGSQVFDVLWIWNGTKQGAN